MRALVTGRRGFLGRPWSRALARAGTRSRALVRRGPRRRSPRSGAEAGGRRRHRPAGGADRGGTAARWCSTWPASAAARDPAEFLRVNAGGTRVVLEAALEAAPRLARFVLAGSLAAAGPSRAPLARGRAAAPGRAVRRLEGGGGADRALLRRPAAGGGGAAAADHGAGRSREPALLPDRGARARARPRRPAALLDRRGRLRPRPPPARRPPRGARGGVLPRLGASGPPPSP